MTHNPIKVEISPTGDITMYAEQKYLSNTQKLIL